MENSTEQISNILNIVLILMVCILFVLIMALIIIKLRESKNKKETNNKNQPDIPTKKTEGKKSSGETYQKESVYDFMDFDKIEDNMIIRKNETKFVMVVKCLGSNFDLASEDEKLAIESGFIKFLNSLKFPIQIYIQAKRFNIDNSIKEYKEKVNRLATEAEKARTNYTVIRRTPNVPENQLRDAYMEFKRRSNIYEYAKDVVANTERIRTNRNILKKDHFIVLTYSPLEEMMSTDMYDKEELKEKAFSELYIRCQSVIRVLNSCDVNGRILNSTELAELLYVAYNREQYEIYGIDKVLNSQFNQLYVTAEDVLDKKMKRLDQKAEIEAIENATELISRAKSDKEKELKEKEENLQKMINEMTKKILDQNKNRIDEDIFKRAEKALEEQVTREKEVKNEKETEETKRTRTTE